MIIRTWFFMIVVSLFVFCSNTLAACYFYGVGTMSGTQKFTVPVSLTLSVPPAFKMDKLFISKILTCKTSEN